MKRLVKKSNKSYQYEELSSSAKEMALQNTRFHYDFEEEINKIKEYVEEFFNNTGFIVFDIYFNLEDNQKNYIEPEVTLEDIWITNCLKEKLTPQEFSLYIKEEFKASAEVTKQHGKMKPKIDVDFENKELEEKVEYILEQEVNQLYQECCNNAVQLFKSDWLEYQSEKYIKSIIKKEDYQFNENGEILKKQ